jgi:neutral ceramidase
MSKLNVGIVGFDITPRIEPVFGAWGTTPSMTEIDMPLFARCIALRQDERLLIWFGSDLVGGGLAETTALRDEVAAGLKLQRDQIIWSTSQTHASPALPGSSTTGSWVTASVQPDEAALAVARRQFIDTYVNAAKQAIEQLQPANVRAGNGYCDSISYNSRLPMPGGGNKFSRNYAEGVQSGKFFDTTIGLVRFDDKHGNPLGAIFNFCCHPAVLIADKYVSPDYVGTARQYVEDEIGGAPAMFIQGFCGDVHCHYMFGTPQQAKELGARLGSAAAKAMAKLIPLRAEPFDWAFNTVDIPSEPMWTQVQIDAGIAERKRYIAELAQDPAAVWCAGKNIAEQMSPEMRAAEVRCALDYFEELTKMLKRGEQPPAARPITLGAVRIGDIGFALSPGENFTLTGQHIRQRSPFTHTLICGDSNGLFSYIGTDDEIDRGGFETDSVWRWISYDGIRLAPAKGASQRVVNTCVALLEQLSSAEHNA